MFHLTVIILSLFGVRTADQCSWHTRRGAAHRAAGVACRGATATSSPPEVWGSKSTSASRGAAAGTNLDGSAEMAEVAAQPAGLVLGHQAPDAFDDAAPRRRRSPSRRRWPVAISLACPSSPKPVMSVQACTLEAAPRLGRGAVERPHPGDGARGHVLRRSSELDRGPDDAGADAAWSGSARRRAAPRRWSRSAPGRRHRSPRSRTSSRGRAPCARRAARRRRAAACRGRPGRPGRWSRRQPGPRGSRPSPAR